MANKICVRCGMEYPNHKMSCKIPVEEWRLPTAEEFLKDNSDSFDTQMRRDTFYRSTVESLCIEFAKLHCEAQLKSILENAKTKTEEDYLPRQGEYVYTQVIDKDSILNAYPLDKII